MNNLIKKINNIHLGPLKKLHFKAAKEMAIGLSLANYNDDSKMRLNNIINFE